jgi:hypothetical protein
MNRKMVPRVINFGARFEYLSAIQEHLPQALASLYQDILPLYQECRQLEEWTTGLRTVADLSGALESKSSPELQALDRALSGWADVHGFPDPWIWDAALQSLEAWALGGSFQSGSTYPRILLRHSLNLPLAIGFLVGAWRVRLLRLRDGRSTRKLLMAFTGARWYVIAPISKTCGVRVNQG